jgi:hypothetical protein
MIKTSDAHPGEKVQNLVSQFGECGMLGFELAHGVLQFPAYIGDFFPKVVFRFARGNTGDVGKQSEEFRLVRLVEFGVIADPLVQSGDLGGIHQPSFCLKDGRLARENLRAARSGWEKLSSDANLSHEHL